MNKYQKSTLTFCDQKLLDELRLKYDAAAKLMGPGPSVYFDFNNGSLCENEPVHFTASRQELFTRLTTVYVKK